MDYLKKRYVSIPNAISVFRILMVIPFAISFINRDYIVSAIVLLISGLSDMVDGIIARKFNQVTKLGQMLDPIADKLTLATVVVCMSIKVPVIIPIAVLFIVKDTLMLLAGLVLIKNGIDLPSAKWYGKIATVSFYCSVITIVTLDAVFGINNIFLSVALLLVTAGFMVFALIKYFMLFLKLIENK